MRLITVGQISNYKNLIQIGKFLVTGVSSALLEIGLLITLVDYAGFHYFYSNIAAFTITNIYTFMLSSKWVFEEGKLSKRNQLLLFFLFVSLGLVLNQVVLTFLVETYDLNYKIAKVFAIGVTVCWNFISRKYLVFK